MYIVDETYFQGLLKVPNLDGMNSTASADLNVIIDGKSRLLLKNALGFEMFKDFDSYVVDGELDVAAPAKWQRLVYGYEYTNMYGQLSRWEGLIYEEGEAKYSILAQFSYYHYLKQQVSYLSGVGEVRAQSKNAVSVNSTSSLTNAWNEFLSMYQGNYQSCWEGQQWTMAHIYRYPWHQVRTIADYNISLIQFLAENQTDYPDLRPVIYELQNVWGV